MIPQYFSSIFEGGVSEMYFTFSFAREYMSHSGPTLECDNALTTTQYHQPSFARVSYIMNRLQRKMACINMHTNKHRYVVYGIQRYTSLHKIPFMPVSEL